MSGQPSFGFDSPRRSSTGPDEMNRNPLARRTDPETSKAAAAAIIPALGAIQRKALDAVREAPRLTVRELARRFGLEDPREIGRRLGELEKLGAVIRGKPRKCSVTGRAAAVWITLTTETDTRKDLS